MVEFAMTRFEKTENSVCLITVNVGETLLEFNFSLQLYQRPEMKIHYFIPHVSLPLMNAGVVQPLLNQVSAICSPSQFAFLIPCANIAEFTTPTAKDDLQLATHLSEHQLPCGIIN